MSIGPDRAGEGRDKAGRAQAAKSLTGLSSMGDPGGAPAALPRHSACLHVSPMLIRAFTSSLLLGLLATTGCASSRAASVSAPGAPETPASGSGAASATSAPGEAASPAGEARTPDERRDALDRELDGSLQAFDALLLKEQQAAAKERAESAASGGAESGGTGAEGGGGEGTAGGGSRAAERGKGNQRAGSKPAAKGSRDDPRESGEPPSGGRPGDDGRTSGAPGTESSQGSGPVPQDVGDGRDDDVVARQIREAAMKEQDPAIREKLWDEYRRYKAGRSGSDK